MSEIKSFKALLSTPRLAKYLHAAGSEQRALELYQLNMLLCERLYIPLHMFEILLRNKIDSALAESYGPQWYNNDQLIRHERQISKIAQTKIALLNKKTGYRRDDLIAELSLGFWTPFFHVSYENLWQQTLHVIGKSDDGKGLTRKFYSTRLSDIRFLRNRVAHHEPIFHMHLMQRLEALFALIKSLSPEAYRWVKQHETFSASLHKLTDWIGTKP